MLTPNVGGKEGDKMSANERYAQQLLQTEVRGCGAIVSRQRAQVAKARAAAGTSRHTLEASRLLRAASTTARRTKEAPIGVLATPQRCEGCWQIRAHCRWNCIGSARGSSRGTGVGRQGRRQAERHHGMKARHRDKMDGQT